jgi:hypothetical protein
MQEGVEFGREGGRGGQWATGAIDFHSHILELSNMDTKPASRDPPEVQCKPARRLAGVDLGAPSIFSRGAVARKKGGNASWAPRRNKPRVGAAFAE